MALETKTCQKCKANFIIEEADFAFYKKMGVPAPNVCPECRFKRRAVFRNEMTLYNRKCALCKKSVISMYNPKSPYTVYCQDCWASDKWDPYSYGKEYDPSRPFFDQVGELVKKVPKAATSIGVSMGQNINAEYTNFAGANKDAYLAFNCGPRNEGIAYCRGLMECRDTFDTYYGEQLERVYEGVNVHKSSGVAWGQNVTDSIESWFLLNCSGCQNCFGCVNLRHTSYHFFNEPLEKDEWNRRVSEVIGSYNRLEEMKKKFREFSLKFPRRENNNLKAVNCIGEYIFDSKNCSDCFEVMLGEDCKHTFATKISKDCYDQLGHGRYSELLLEGVAVGAGSSHVLGSWSVESSHDIEYSFRVRSSAYCIGCDGIKGAEYVILNRKYSKEEYEKIREQIVAELKSKNLYGAFFPSELAFFGYNETIGQDNFPLTKQEALVQGFRWEDDIQMTTGKETLKPEQIPDHIKDVPDSIMNEILVCGACGRNYKIIKMELDFYRSMVLPIPRKCFYCRHRDRLARRGPMKIFDRICAKCAKPIKTTYAPDRPEVVYCVECYQREVV